MPRLLLIAAVLCLGAASVAAQTARLRVYVHATGKPVTDAEVRVTDMTDRTDAAGVVSVSVEAGTVHVIVMKRRSNASSSSIVRPAVALTRSRMSPGRSLTDGGRRCLAAAIGSSAST